MNVAEKFSVICLKFRTRSDKLAVIQGVSRLVDITAGSDFLGLSEQKVHINMCPILNCYGVMDIF